MFCWIVQFKKYVVQRVKNPSYFPKSVVWVVMVRRVIIVSKMKESKNVEEATACHRVGIKWSRVLLISVTTIFEAVTLVMSHLNYKSKNLYISSIVVSGGFAAVFPVVLDDIY
jgi:cbb3-type cytochrome oxidase subunit 1